MGRLLPGGGGIGTIKQMIKNGYLQNDREVSFAMTLTDVLKLLYLILITTWRI